MLNCRDISERKAFEEQLAHQAFHDRHRASRTARCSPTACGTRSRARARERPRRRGAVPRPRRLQDDQRQPRPRRRRRVLREVAQAPGDWHPCDRDTAARFGGDEFAVLLEDSTASQEAADAAERVLEALTRRSTLDGKELSSARSIGICGRRRRTSARRRRGADPQRRRRDVHRQARRQGQLPALRARDARRRASRGSSCAPTCSARSTQDQLELYYQPVVRLDDGAIYGRRGAAALAPSRARADPAGPVHPARRGDRPDHPDRPLGAARGLPPARVDAARASRADRRSR